MDLGNRNVNDLAFGDADNDGDIELLAARDGREDSDAGRIVVIHGPAESWRQSDFANDWGNSDRHALTVAIGNLDGDDTNEIAVGRDAGDNARVIIYRFSNGAYRNVADIGDSDSGDWGSSRRATALAFADVDGNSREGYPPDQELIVGRNATCSGCDPGARLIVYDGPINDRRLRTVASLVTTGEGAWDELRGVQSLAAADIDGDGKAEIVVGRNTGDNDRVIVFDDASAGFSVMHAFGDKWERPQRERDRDLEASRLPEQAAPADARHGRGRQQPVPASPCQRDPLLGEERRVHAGRRSWIRKRDAFARKVFGEWGKNPDDSGEVHTVTRRILAGAAAIAFNLQPEAGSLMTGDFIGLMNRYIVENVTFYKDVGTARTSIST